MKYLKFIGYLGFVCVFGIVLYVGKAALKQIVDGH